MTIDPVFATLAPLVVSILSLILATISFILNYRLSKRDKERNEQLSELQLRIHELQLQKEEEAAERRSSSKVEAHHVLVGLKNHRIRISNTGGTVVTDITCSYDEENGPYILRQDKEPFERLEPGESFDESAVFASGTPSKFVITTHWIDSGGKQCSRENIITW